MRCPYCGHEDSQVKDSRPTEDGAAIRRRRQCEDCGARFTTFERIQLRDVAVLKALRRHDAALTPRAALAQCLGDADAIQRGAEACLGKQGDRRGAVELQIILMDPRSGGAPRLAACGRWLRESRR